MMRDNKRIQLGLIGNGISNSRAKSLHEMLGRLHNLSVSYTPMDQHNKPHVDIASELTKCAEQGFRGVNVTHPFKQLAFQSLNNKPAVPETVTSINTVVFEDNGWIGTNTDYSGFIHAFKRNLPNTQPGKVLMLGAGGVGIAIAAGLAALNAEELVIYDTDKDKTHALIERFKGTDFPVRHIEGDLIDEMRMTDGLINGTPLGMHQYRKHPFPVDGIGNQSWAFDAVYTPENTDFLAECREKNIVTLSGFQLFLHQGIDAFEVFSSITVDADDIEKQYLKEHPIVINYQ